MTVPSSTVIPLVLLACWAGLQVARRFSSKTTVPQRAPESISDEEILREHFAGRRINALMLYRIRHACGLKDAQKGLQALANAATRK
ncbi:hypothetical protein [Dyella mobilis]|uniref:Uncharacterized protein n=1 Tax=Dyella mobilis TaxID=1849582 RepID=A0ABS2KL21_9GAMM|nr:hypothetical protein [Dyella mobilis]MBM7131720.1 hypothetical protein [Dyella mobilis]GLQ96304.1 hypothetical protein GCM10007863_07220 [Dyella mobilis]